MSEQPVFNASQPIVFQDGTMQYSFARLIQRVNTAVNNAAITSTWGSIGGSISTQTDLIGGGKILSSLISEESVTQHESALSIVWSQITSPEFVPPEVRDEATTPYSLAVSDANKVIRFTANNADVTLPPEATAAFTIGTIVTFRQAGTGTLTFTTTGLTINGTLPALAQNTEITLRKVGADEWDVI